MLTLQPIFNLDDLHNTSGVYSNRPLKNYCFNYSEDGVMTVVARYIKSYGYSKEEAYKRALAWLQKDNQFKVTVYPKNYPADRCDNKFGGHNSVPQDFSNASGDNDKAVRNAMCRVKCNIKVNKTKKSECILECDKNFPPSEKQESKREEKEIRQDAREDKRDTKDELKKLLREGKISKAEYDRRMKTARDTKQDIIKNDGGGKGLTRAFRGVNKVNPLLASGRAGMLLFARQNVVGISTRLAPALVSDEIAKQKFTPQAVQLAKQGWAKTKKAWRNLGGNEFKLEEAILHGYTLKPEKLPRNSDTTSSAAGVDDVLSMISSALAILGGIIRLINQVGVEKDPYQDGKTPIDLTRSMQDGTVDEVPDVDPNAPIIDPKTGNWIDPTTGKAVDPKTGVDLILGMTPLVFWTATTLTAVAVGFGIYKIVKQN